MTKDGYVTLGIRHRNSEGQLVADKIRFDEQDLRTAQALKSTVDPLEAEVTNKLKEQQAAQEKFAEQLEEAQAVATSARADAASAKSDAAKAQATADFANNRINGLDDFDPIKTVTVNFNNGSA